MRNGFTLQNFSKKNLGGFTIIEFLIYITILVIAIAAMGLVLSNILRVGVRIDIVQEVNHNGRFAMQRIGQAVEKASAIENEDNKLVLLLEDPDNSPAIFDVSEGKLRIKEGEKDYIELTTSRVIIDRFFLKKVSEDSVRVEINISFYNPQNLPEYEFKSFFTGSFTLKN